MDLRRLRYFVAVAEDLNFTQAARRLCVTQPALSKQIFALERELDVQLFLRDRRCIRLTTAGKELLEESAELLARFQQAIERTQQAASGVIGILRIGYLGVPQMYFLPSFLNTFSRSFPSINLSLRKMNSWDYICESLDNEDIDVAFTVSLGLESVRNLSWETIRPDGLEVLMPVGHNLANERTIDLSLLAKEKFISPVRDVCRPVFDHNLQLCANHGFSLNIVCQSPDMETVFALVEAGMGICFVSRTAAEAYNSPNIRHIGIDNGGIRLGLAVAWKNGNANPSIPWALKELKFISPDPR